MRSDLRTQEKTINNQALQENLCFSRPNHRTNKELKRKNK